ncbi:MAG: hypothetical protein ACP5VE_04565 [Chthonomonadales bacterium]
MPKVRVEKILVCPECGQPIARKPIPGAAVERTAASADAGEDEDIIADDQDVEVEMVIEQGPVCPRCAGYR